MPVASEMTGSAVRREPRNYSASLSTLLVVLNWPKNGHNHQRYRKLTLEFCRTGYGAAFHVGDQSATAISWKNQRQLVSICKMERYSSFHVMIVCPDVLKRDWHTLLRNPVANQGALTNVHPGWGTCSRESHSSIESSQRSNYGRFAAIVGPNKNVDLVKCE